MSELPLTWRIISGRLPDGLNLSVNGVISGIPAKAGKYTFTLKAENSLRSDVRQLICFVEKGSGAIVDSPTVKSKTYNSITLNAVPAPPEQTIEYAICASNIADEANMIWQEEVIFEDLTPFATYYVYARAKENENYLSGEASVSGEIITE